MSISLTSQNVPSLGAKVHIASIGTSIDDAGCRWALRWDFTWEFTWALVVDLYELGVLGLGSR